MKQMIVLIAMVVLGIAIAGFVISFQDTAETISTNANSGITTFFADKFTQN